MLWQSANVGMIGKSVKQKFAYKASEGSYRAAQASCKVWMNGLRKKTQLSSAV